MQRAAAQAGVGGDDEAERTPHPADLLDGDRVGERVEPGASLVLGDRDAEPAHLAEPLHDLAREPSLPLVSLDLRRDLGRHELPDGVAQERVLRGQIEVHRPRVHRGCAAVRRGRC